MILRTFLISLSIAYSSALNASVVRDDDKLLIEGNLLNSDADSVVELINEHVIHTIVFKNSPGGEWRAGMRIGNFISSKNITTIVEGVCASACTLAFLGGDKRKFSHQSNAPILFFHAPYSADNQRTIENLKRAFFSWIEYRTKKEIPVQFSDAMNNTISARGGIFLFSADDPIVKSAGGGITQICKGSEIRIPLDCERTDAISAVSLGIINEE